MIFQLWNRAERVTATNIRTQQKRLIKRTEGRDRWLSSDGAISTDDLLVQGKGFSMIGHGKLFFLDD